MSRGQPAPPLVGSATTVPATHRSGSVRQAGYRLIEDM
jgi:hypothetical protein